MPPTDRTSFQAVVGFRSSAPGTHASGSEARRALVLQRYAEVRAHSLDRAAPLSAEDQCVQSMPDASPTKWHLAHTSWFFEAFVLVPHCTGYRAFDPRFFRLFNSYYEAMGPRHPRHQRGLLTRPSSAEVLGYRQHVDTALVRWLRGCSDAAWATVEPLITLGLQHEQQHQELLLTDALHLLWCNPLLPVYAAAPAASVAAAPCPARPALDPLRWLRPNAGPHPVGHAGEGFAFDNEGPRHTVWLTPCEVAHRLVTCGEFAQFIASGGYQRPDWWLADGWAAAQAGGWQAPLYWLRADDPRLPPPASPASGPGFASAGVDSAEWWVFGLHGAQPMRPDDPVSHLSFYEAAAFAEWASTQPGMAGVRLPTEFEWEAACGLPGMEQTHGAVWQWTRSAYDPYPGFRPNPGAVGEYNGKFMANQYVLRGSSQATPSGHGRPTYRNFFPAGARWQFSGLRLARDATC